VSNRKSPRLPEPSRIKDPETRAWAEELIRSVELTLTELPTEDEVFKAVYYGMTGLLSAGSGTLSAGDTSSTFDVASGIAVFSDQHTNPQQPTTRTIRFGPFEEVTPEFLTTSVASFIYLDSGGNLVQTTQLESGGFLRDHVALGIITHADLTNIDSISSNTQTAVPEVGMGVSDISSCIGPVNCGGNIVTGVSAELKIDVSEGTWYFHGINFRNDLKDPSTIFTSALSAPSFFLGWRNVDNPLGTITITSAIPAGVYDDGTATSADTLPVGAVLNNSWVNNRVYKVVDSNQIAILFGQDVYNTKSAARDGIGSELFETLPAFQGLAPIATVTMRGGATDLADPADAEIRQAIHARATFI
jgi:hypothetical protein